MHSVSSTSADVGRRRAWRRRGRVGIGAGLFVAFSAGTCSPALAQVAPLVDWRPRNGAVSDAGSWTINRWGPVRNAALGESPQPDGRDAGIRAVLESVDAQPPPANLVYPLALEAGHVYRVTVELRSVQPANVEVMIRRRGFPYEAAGIRTVQLGSAWQTVTLRAAWPDGGAPADVRIAPAQARADLVVRRLVVSDEAALPLGTVPSTPFSSRLVGLHVNQLGVHRVWPPFGQGLLRLWDTGTTWNVLAPTRTAWKDFDSPGWRRLDDYVRYAQEGDPGTAILFVLGQPPAWASDQPAAKCSYGAGSCGGPASLDDWREYVGTLARRYKGRIRYWELWNEVDQPQFYVGGASMVDLARIAKTELTSVDADNRLFTPSYTRYGIRALERFLHDGGAAHVDGVAAHWYFDGEPERMASHIFNVRETMRAYGIDGKPLWNTEGAPLCESRREGRCIIGSLSDDEQEALVARAQLTMWLNGVQGYAHYFLEGMNGQTLALLDPGRKTVTSAGRGFAAFSRWMVGSKASKLSSFGRRGHLLALEREGESFQVAWSEARDDILQLPSDGGVARYRTLGGNWTPLPADRRLPVGRVPVMLAGQPRGR